MTGEAESGVADTVEGTVVENAEVSAGPGVVDGGIGHSDTALGVPAKLGRDGVREIVEWELPEYETELLADAAEKLSDQYDTIA